MDILFKPSFRLAWACLIGSECKLLVRRLKINTVKWWVFHIMHNKTAEHMSTGCSAEQKSKQLQRRA